LSGAIAAGSAPAGAQDELPDPCTLVSAGDLKKRLDVTAAGTPASNADISACVFTREDGTSVFVRVSAGPTDAEAKKACSKQESNALGFDVSKVKKVGDVACVRTSNVVRAGNFQSNSVYPNAVAFLSHKNGVNLELSLGGSGDALMGLNPKPVRKGLVAVGKKAVKKL
jgi:hypothetical protein